MGETVSFGLLICDISVLGYGLISYTSVDVSGLLGYEITGQSYWLQMVFHVLLLIIM